VLLISEYTNCRRTAEFDRYTISETPYLDAGQEADFERRSEGIHYWKVPFSAPLCIEVKLKLSP
jgi:hypothetical protein